MGKWLSGIITTIVVLALTTLVAATLKGPIDDWASRDRLRAEVQLSPWYAKPDAAPAKPADKTVDLSTKLAEVQDQMMVATTDASDFGLARLIVTNESSKPVTNVNVRLLSPYSAGDALVIGPDGKKTGMHDVDRIMLPDLKPGDKVVTFMWGRFNTYTFSDAFRTYSSEGRFRVTYDWPTAQDRAYESWIGRFINDYATIFVSICVVLLLLVLAVVAASYNQYFKLLLKDRDHYKQERRRFLEEPAKFEPKYEKATPPPPSPPTPPPAPAPGVV